MRHDSCVDRADNDASDEFVAGNGDGDGCDDAGTDGEDVEWGCGVCNWQCWQRRTYGVVLLWAGSCVVISVYCVVVLGGAVGAYYLKVVEEGGKAAYNPFTCFV